jgi:tetratricopeptide (TPR) repeat protein
MAKDLIGIRIETLIQKGEWVQAQSAIGQQLAKEPDDHWLWSRLSGVRYERQDYQGAFEAAEKALAIVPDCPLAIWSKAGAIEMLGNVDLANALYVGLFRRGLEELKNPDQDAEQCWESQDWTVGLMMDAVFRTAGCQAKIGNRERAIETYQYFLGMLHFGTKGIYSHEDALKKIDKLVPTKEAKRNEMVKMGTDLMAHQLA